jgi:hypothetical protein
MKAPACFALCSLLFAAPVFSQEDQTPPVKPPVVAPPSPTPIPRPTPKNEPAKKPEPPAVIEGMTIPRGTGFLGIAIVDSTFRLSFYDAEKKPVAPDVARAALRWPVKYQPGDERTVLNLASDGKSLASAFVVRPPYFFKLFITLIAEDAPSGAGETFVVDFRG